MTTVEDAQKAKAQTDANAKGKYFPTQRPQQNKKMTDKELLELPLHEMITEISSEIPDSEWEKLPRDLSQQVDHYVYGLTKKKDKLIEDIGKENDRE